jgi:lipopolysaccharide export system protein LptC
MNRRTLLLLSLVAVLFLATTWLSQKGKQPSVPLDASGAPIATYFIRGLDGIVTNADGLAGHELKSESLFGYADNGLVELKKPQLTIYLPQGEQWQVEADEGQMESESNQISLTGSVILTQQTGDHPIKVETDRLQLYPDARYGESDGQVTISSASGRISGIGMQLFGNERRLLLLSEVRGHYETTR